jgi:hypothetical protein
MGKLVQVQTSSVNLMLSLREQIRRKRICITQEFDSPLGKVVVSDIKWPLGSVRASVDETKTVLRREPFNSEPIINYLSGKRVQLVQPAEIAVCTITQLRANKPEDTQKIDLKLIFDLSIYNVDNDVFLSIRFNSVEGLPLGVAGFDQVEKQIAQDFPTHSLPIDVGQISGLDGKPVVANVGIAAAMSTGTQPEMFLISDPDSHAEALGDWFAVAIRIEIGNYPVNVDLWEQFYSSTHEALFRGNWFTEALKWSIFIDGFFIRQALRKRMEESFQTSGKFKLKGGIAANWTAPDETHGHVHLDFFGDALEACGPADIGLQVNVRVEFSVIEPRRQWPRDYDSGLLHQFVKINYWKDDLDTALCLAGVAAIWPYIGPKLMDEDELNWLELLGSFLLPPLITVFSLKVANKSGRSPDLTNCVRTDPDKDEFNCTRPFNSGNALIGGLPELHELQARLEGPVFSGDLFWRKRLGRDFKLSAVNIQPFKLATQHFDCNQIGAAGLGLINEHPEWVSFYEASITLEFEVAPLSATNEVDGIGTSSSNLDIIPSYICSARVRPEDDSLNIFGPYITIDDSSPYFKVIVIRLPLTVVSEDYFNAPYPCYVLIQTSAGARMITIPAITRVTKQEAKNAALGAWARRVSICKAKSQSYNPQWIIDPPDFYEERHRWEVVVSGLQPHEEVFLRTVETAKSHTIASVRANRNGMAVLRANLLPESYGGKLNFRRSIQSANDTGRSATGGDMKELETRQVPVIDVKQTELLLISQIPIDESFVSVAPLIIDDRPALLTLTTDAVAIIDLSHATHPSILVQKSINGISGTVAAGEAILAWAEQGVLRLTVDLEAGDVRFESLSTDRVDAMVNSGSRILILSQGRLEVWNHRRSQESSIEVQDGYSLAASSSHALVCTPYGVKVFEIQGERLRAANEHPSKDVQRVLWLEEVCDDHQFLLESSQGIELVDVSDPERLVVLGHFPNTSQISTFITGRNLLIEVDKVSSRINVFRTGKRVWQ